MIKRVLGLALFAVMSASAASVNNGLISVYSPHSVEDTTNRLVKAMENRGISIFRRINHEKGAENVGHKLRPSQLLIFGNPKIGSLLMQCNQQVGIELPQKILIWQTKDRKVKVTYNDPKYFAERHQIKNCDEVIQKINNGLNALIEKATKE